MTDFNNVTVSSNGHELIALEVNVEEQVGPVGGAIVCRDIAGNVGVRVDVATDQAGGSSVLIRNGAYKLVNSKGEFRGILSWADESVNKDGGVLELISSTDSPDPLPDGEASPRAIVLTNGRSVPSQRFRRFHCRGSCGREGSGRGLGRWPWTKGRVHPAKRRRQGDGRNGWRRERRPIPSQQQRRVHDCSAGGGERPRRDLGRGSRSERTAGVARSPWLEHHLP